MKRHLSFLQTRTCASCPWLKSSAPGRYSPSWYERMKETCEEGFNAVFPCHQYPRESLVCAGYLMSPDSRVNGHIRLALARKQFDPKRLTSTGPLFTHYVELAAANGASVRLKPVLTRGIPHTDRKRYTPLRVSVLQVSMSDWLFIIGDGGAGYEP